MITDIFNSHQIPAELISLDPDRIVKVDTVPKHTLDSEKEKDMEQVSYGDMTCERFY